jgi:hypothetical protein
MFFTSDEATKLVLVEGERQAIEIAVSMGSDTILLIDDRAGRQAAEKLNWIPVPRLRPAGTSFKGMTTFARA